MVSISFISLSMWVYLQTLQFGRKFAISSNKILQASIIMDIFVQSKILKPAAGVYVLLEGVLVG